MWSTIAVPLDLKRCVALERFEFTVELQSVSEVHDWILQTVRTITSPLFNEFVIWILRTTFHRWGQLWSLSKEGLKAVDASLNVIAGRNPNFRLVFQGDFSGEYGVIRHVVGIDYLPLASSKGYMMFEQAEDEESPLFKSGVLYPDSLDYTQLFC